MIAAPGQKLSHYLLAEEVGRGGMGVVYRARDLVLDRDVALKVLPPEVVADPGRKSRFLREAKAAALLDHPHIAVVYEAGEAEGVSFIAMEFIRGEKLRELLARGTLPVGRALDLGLEVAEGLACAHGRGVVHRDLKPANIMVTTDGRAKIIDFGVATLVNLADQSGTTRTFLQDITAPGCVLGTAAYMSPEQVRGEPVDHRSDLFAFGLVLYEMLTGGHAFRGATTTDTLHAILHDDPPRLPAPIAGRATEDLQRVVDTCLRKQARDRYSRSEELVVALRALRQRGGMPVGAPAAPLAAASILARLKRRPLVAACAVLLLVAAGVLTVRTAQQRSGVRWARTVALPEAARLAEVDDNVAAYALAVKAEQFLADDPALEALFARVSQYLSITSDPAGAAVALASYAGVPPEEVALGRTPLAKVRVPLAPFWLTVQHNGHATSRGFYRGLSYYSPPGEMFPISVTLDKEEATVPGMVRVSLPPRAAGVELYGLARRTGLTVPAFLIDQREVTNAEFKRFVDAGGYTNASYWRREFRIGGHTVPFREGVSGFVDRTGRPGPATWEAGAYPQGEEDYPVAGVSWYEAGAYAAFVGKALPTIYHWLAAANTNLAAHVVTFSNIGGHGLRQAGIGPVGPRGVWDMAGNVKEWCSTAVGEARFILGGAWNEPAYMFYEADAQSPFDRRSTYGFRCVRYLDDTDPRVLAELLQPTALEGRTPRIVLPPSDELFAAYLGHYAYDSTPLNDTLDAVDASPPLWTKERVRFDAAYGDERVVAYLFRPKGHAPPYQTVVFFPGAAALRQSSDQLQTRVFDYVVSSGRAVLYPVYKGTHERRDTLEMVDAGPTTAYASYVTRWMKDLRRSVDYLATRKDVDSTKIAYYGFSWGASLGPIALAVEPRLRLGVLLDGGLWPVAARPEVTEATFAPRVKVPVLMINGTNDAFFPIEWSQKPLFDLLGTPPAMKRHVTYDSGHGVMVFHRNEAVRTVLSWLDQHFGPPARSPSAR